MDHSPSFRAPDKFERFEAWLRDNGAKFDMLELREYDCAGGSNDDEEKKEIKEESELRGVHARRPIPPQTTCVEIPRRCLITVEMGQATPIGQAIMHADLDLDAPKHIFLMIYILWDRRVNGARSFFHPYYEILPQTLRNMPIFWSPSEMAELEGSHLLYQVADRNQAILEDYNAILSVAPSLADLASLDEFKWARMCVCSRNFGLTIDGHRTSALVPHADMLNHYRPRETKWTFDEDKQSFTITSLQHIAAGAQVYDSYGQKCNHRFLLNYGFAVEDNRELDGFCPNEVPLELYVDPSDPLFSEKLEFWTRGDNPALSGMVTASLIAQANQAVGRSGVLNQDQVSMLPATTPVIKRVRVCVSNNENTRLLFSLLRALACDSAELESVSSAPVSHDGVTRALFGLNDPMLRHSFPGSSYHRSCRDIRHPVSIRNERAAMRLLIDTVHRQLNQYPTSLTQDLGALNDEHAYPQFSNQRHAKIQVRGEKQVLHHFRIWAETALEVLDVMEDELTNSGNVEVQLVSANGRAFHSPRTHVQEQLSPRPSFDRVIRAMEQEVDTTVHHTILRYCADVLGSLRREEIKQMRQDGTRRHVGQHRPQFRSNGRY